MEPGAATHLMAAGPKLEARYLRENNQTPQDGLLTLSRGMINSGLYLHHLSKSAHKLLKINIIIYIFLDEKPKTQKVIQLASAYIGSLLLFYKLPHI